MVSSSRFYLDAYPFVTDLGDLLAGRLLTGKEALDKTICERISMLNKQISLSQDAPFNKKTNLCKNMHLDKRVHLSYGHPVDSLTRKPKNIPLLHSIGDRSFKELCVNDIIKKEFLETDLQRPNIMDLFIKQSIFKTVFEQKMKLVIQSLLKLGKKKCVSKKIRNSSFQDELISELFNKYIIYVSSNKCDRLVLTPLLRKCTKANLMYKHEKSILIKDFVIPNLLKEWEKDAFLQDYDIVEFLYKFYCIILP